MRKLAIYTGVTGFVILAIWAVFFRGESRGDATGFQIDTAQVERGDVARLVAASGAVRALTTVEVGSQVSGQILELMADYNSEVTEGQIIARIDPQTFETRVASGRADVASAQASLEVQRQTIHRSEAILQESEKDSARKEALYAQDAIALSVLENTQRQLAVSRADLLVARAQLTKSRATLAQREASLGTALVDLERATIRSPIDGVVIERNVDVGQTVAASFSAPVLFRIAQDLGDIRIDAAVVEADIGGINQGDPATFKVDAYPEQTFTGVVEQVRLSAQELQNIVTYTVVIAARNRTGRLLPGMTANVEITAEKREDVLRLSATTLRFRPPVNGPTVLTVDGGSEQGSGRRSGPRAGGGRPNVLGDLKIEPDRKAAIEKQIGDEIRKIREAMSGPGAAFNRNALRERIRARMDKVLRDNLTPEEYKTVLAARNARTSVRSVEMYQQTTGGELQTKSVTVGLSDGSYVEILRGAEVGDIFVTRIKTLASGN